MGQAKIHVIRVGNKIYRYRHQYRRGQGGFEGTELHVFGFDHSLFRSPLKPSWWPFASWKGHLGSLAPPCVPEKPGASWWNTEIKNQAKKSIADKNSWTILITTRNDDTFKTRITEMLKQEGLVFDELLLKNTTVHDVEFKLLRINDTLDDFPDITTVHIWDEESEILNKVEDELEVEGYEVVKHKVPEGHHELDCKEKDLEDWEGE
jgi:hypothetical protein